MPSVGGASLAAAAHMMAWQAARAKDGDEQWMEGLRGTNGERMAAYLPRVAVVLACSNGSP